MKPQSNARAIRIGGSLLMVAMFCSACADSGFGDPSAEDTAETAEEGYQPESHFEPVEPPDVSTGDDNDT